MRKIVILVGFVFMLLATTPLYALSLTGNWFMNANGWKGVLALTQNGNNITGTMTDLSLNISPAIITNISGQVAYIPSGYPSGTWSVTIDRTLPNGSVQTYNGYIFTGDPSLGVVAEKGMAGTFSCTGQDYGWFAEKY